MNIFRKAAIALGLKMAAFGGVSLSLTDPKGWKPLLSRSHTGKTITDDTALQVSVVWACVRILSESIGMLPLAVYRRDAKGNAQKVDDHPLAEVLVGQPNREMTSVEFREALQTNLGLRGNGYAMIERRSNGQVIGLMPITSANVEPRLADNGEVEFRVLDRGKWETYPREKIWHLKGFGHNGLVGLSPIGCVRESMGLALATEEFQARFFGEGARPSAVAKIPQWLKDDQRKLARENLQALLGGLENAHKVHLLEGGMELEPWGMPLEDLQFVELRRFQLDEICRIYGVPPHRVANLERATFSNIEQMSLEFVMYTLMPWIRRWEASAERWLLPVGERDGRTRIAFNFEGLLRADSAARAQFYSQMLQNGVYNRNEVRALENRNSVEGLDDYTVQSNMTIVQLLEAMAAQNATAPKPAAPEPEKAVAPVEIKLQSFEDAVGAVAKSTAQSTGALVELARSQDAIANALVNLSAQMKLQSSITTSLNDGLSAGLSAVVEEVRRPRKAVLDADGNPIGSVPVDSLH